MKAPENVIGMGLVSFFTDFASSLVTPILPLFVVLVLNQGVDKLGLILAITTLVSYLLRFVGGALSDRYQNNKCFLILGYGLSAIAKPCLGFCESWSGIATVQSSERLGKALRAAPKDKLLTSSCPTSQLGQCIGLHKAIEKSGQLLGLVTLLLIIYYYGTTEQVMRSVFTLTAIPGLLSVLVLCLFVKEISGGKSKKAPTFRFAIEPQTRRPLFAYALLTLFMFNEAFFILIGQQMGIALPQLLMIYIASRGIQIVISLKASKLIDNTSQRTLLISGYLAGLCSLLLLLPGNSPCFIVAFLLMGIYDVITLNAIRSYIGQTAKNKGATFGTLYFLVAITSAFGLYVLSLIWHHFGVHISILFAVAGVLLSGAFITYLIKPTTMQQKINPVT